MIRRKKKMCKGCGEEQFLYARGVCQNCDRRVNSTKYQLKAKVTPSGLELPKKAYRIKPISDSRKRDYEIYYPKRDLYLSDNPVCEFPNCTSRVVELHHKKHKIGKLLYDECYFCALCRNHHRWVHEHPTESYKMGLLIEM